MRATTRAGRMSKAVALLAAGAVGGGAALAVASVPGQGGVISACVAVTTDAGGTTVPYQESNQFLQPAGNFEIIDTGAGQTCTGLGTYAGTTLTWNQAGIQGPQGAPGAQGPPGPPGPPGTGTTIGTVDVTGGATLGAGTIDLSGGGTGTIDVGGGGVLQTGTLDLGSGATINAATVQHILPPPQASGVAGGGHLAGAVQLGSGAGSIYFRFSSIALGSAVNASGHSLTAKPSGAALIRFTKLPDKASLALFKALQRRFKSAEIVEGVPGRSSHLQLSLTVVALVAVQDAGVGGGIVESVDVVYKTLTTSYQSGDVTATSVWKNSP